MIEYVRNKAKETRERGEKRHKPFLHEKRKC